MNANDWEVFGDGGWFRAFNIKSMMQHTLYGSGNYTGEKLTIPFDLWKKSFTQITGEAKLSALRKMGLITAEEPPAPAPAVATLPNGLTKREDFAKAAMQGLMAAGNYSSREEDERDEISRVAILQADSMLSLLAESAKSEAK